MSSFTQEFSRRGGWNHEGMHQSPIAFESDPARIKRAEHAAAIAAKKQEIEYKNQQDRAVYAAAGMYHMPV